MVCAGVDRAGLSLAGFVVEGKDRSEVGVAGIFEDLQDSFEGSAVVGAVGEIDDACIVCRQPDDEIIEAAGTAGVEEEFGIVVVEEPAGGVVAFVQAGDGEAKAAEGGREGQESVLLQCIYPFGIVGQGGIDAAVAFGGAGNALIGGIAHGAVRDVAACFVDGGAIHVQGQEDVLADEFREGCFRDAFDDEGEETETRVAVSEAAAGCKIGAVVGAEQAEDVGVEHLGRLSRRDQGFIVEDA